MAEEHNENITLWEILRDLPLATLVGIVVAWIPLLIISLAQIDGAVSMPPGDFTGMEIKKVPKWNADYALRTVSAGKSDYELAYDSGHQQYIVAACTIAEGCLELSYTRGGAAHPTGMLIRPDGFFKTVLSRDANNLSINKDDGTIRWRYRYYRTFVPGLLGNPGWEDHYAKVKVRADWAYDVLLDTVPKERLERSHSPIMWVQLPVYFWTQKPIDAYLDDFEKRRR